MNLYKRFRFQKFNVSRRESATKVCNLKNEKWNLVHLKDLVCKQNEKDIAKLRNQRKTVKHHKVVLDNDDFLSSGVNNLAKPPENLIDTKETFSPSEKLHENTKYDLSMSNHNDDQLLTLSFEKKVLSDNIANSFSKLSDLNVYSDDREKPRNAENEIYDPTDLVKHLNSVCCNLVRIEQ